MTIAQPIYKEMMWIKLGGMCWTEKDRAYRATSTLTVAECEQRDVVMPMSGDATRIWERS